MKKWIIILFMFFLSINCSTPKSTFFNKKHPTENRNSYTEKRNLMLLQNTQLGRNKALYSKHNIKTRNKAYKKYKKQSKYRRFKQYR
jgi:hypothetical protein